MRRRQSSRATNSAGARLHPITVISETPGLYVPAPLDAGEYAQYVAAVRARQANTVRAAIGQLREAGIDVVAETPGGAAEEVLTTRSSDVDLLVLGSRGYGPLRSVLLGSVSTHLVRRSACPLLVLPRRTPQP